MNNNNTFYPVPVSGPVSTFRFPMLSAVLAAMFALTVTGNAQESVRLRRNAIKVNVLSPIYNTLNLSYQHLLERNDRSLCLGISYMEFRNFNGYNSNTGLGDETVVTGVNATVEYRVNFSPDDGISGWYGAPFVRYLDYTRAYTDRYMIGGVTVANRQRHTFRSGGVGFVIGYQFLLGNLVTIDFFGGPVYQLLLDEQRPANPSGNVFLNRYLSGSIPDRYLNGYGLRGGITVGMCF